MKPILNQIYRIFFRSSGREIAQSLLKTIKKSSKSLLLAAVVISFAGCTDLSTGPEEANVDLFTNETIFAEVTPSDTCPVVTGEDVAGVVAPMFHPHLFNVQLRKAEGLLLPAVQAVQGHFRIKLCETLTENYQFEWNLRINNKKGLGFTGWSLTNRETEEELIGIQFPNKLESGRKVQNSGIMEVNGEILAAPEDVMIVIRTTDTEINLVGLLLPAVQAKGD